VSTSPINLFGGFGEGAERFFNLPEQFSGLPDHFSSLPDQLSELPEHFSGLPDHFSSLREQTYLITSPSSLNSFSSYLSDLPSSKNKSREAKSSRLFQIIMLRN